MQEPTELFRIEDPALTATRVDFSLDPGTGRWRSAPLQQIAGLLTETAQQHVLDVLATMPLREVLVSGVALTRERITQGLLADSRLAQTGLALVDGAPHICDQSSDPASDGWQAARRGYEFLASFVF